MLPSGLDWQIQWRNLQVHGGTRSEPVQEIRLHPLKGGVIRHFDVTGKNCPKWFVPKSKGGSDTEDTQHWHKFLADVAAQMGQGTAATKPSSSATTVKLRYDWKQGQRVQLYKEKTQLFANESATTPAGYLPKGTYYIYDASAAGMVAIVSPPRQSTVARHRRESMSPVM